MYFHQGPWGKWEGPKTYLCPLPGKEEAAKSSWKGLLLGEKITKKRVRGLLPHDPDVCQNVSVSKDINGGVKTSDKVAKYRTRFVINSSYKPCDVEAMMVMKKDTVCKWFHNSVRMHASVKSSRLSFAQDGGGQKQNAPQISFCDGRLYSEVAAGKASRKTSTVPVVANVDHSESVVCYM